MKDFPPFMAIGNGELDDNPDVGKTAVCPRCHKEHKVEYGEKVLKTNGYKIPDTTLAFVRCKRYFLDSEKTYLVGFNGKLLRPPATH